MSKVRIALVDDHVIVRQGLKMLINCEADLEVVGEAGDGAAALEMIAALQPEISVVDVSMPGLNGVELTTLLKSSGSSTKVLALTAHEERGYVQQLLKAGALGFLLKRSAANELLRAIRTVAGGGRYLDPEMVEDLVHNVPEPVRIAAPGDDVALSEREREVVRLIAHGFTNKEIAAQLDISMKTVESYKARSMLKLGLRGRAELVRFVIEQGWMQEAPVKLGSIPE